MPYAAPQGAELEVFNRVTGAVLAFEDTVGQDFRQRAHKLYARYRGFQKFANEWERTGPNDRDELLVESARAWGAHVVVPYAFAAVETLAPRIVAQRPKMLVRPRMQRWEENVLPVRLTLDAQQSQIDFDLRLQSVLKDGLIYGIGFGKSYWRKSFALRRVVKPKLFRPGQFQTGKLEWVPTFDDPDFEPVHPFDMMWDPFATTIEGAEWAVHRAWRSTAYCMDRIRSKEWNTEAAQLLDAEDLDALRSNTKYDEVWQEHMEASGYGSRWSSKGDVHEVLEFHDGVQVITLLDRQPVVQHGENPCVGHKPFVAYRPNEAPKNMVGIGVVEPIEPLLRELDTLRSQRRDAATMALMAGYAYDSTAVDEEDIVFGPAVAIEVRNASPRDAIMPLQRQEVPGTAYQEEESILRDLERVVGLQDMGGEQYGPAVGGDTATGQMLMQAAITRRVENQSMRLEKETVRAATRLFLRLNQRMIMEPRDRAVEVPQDGEYDPGAEKRYTWFKAGPMELRGEYEVEPDGGSMAPANVQQKRADANLLANMLLGRPGVNQRFVLLRIMDLCDIEAPQGWLEPDAPTIPASVLENLEKRGVRRDVIEWSVRQAQAAEPPATGGPGPVAGDVGQAGTEQAAAEPPAEAMAQ